jgi:hypothetical protein
MFLGAWQRVSLSLCGDPEHEPEYVYWLQAETWFVDLRVNRETAQVTGSAAGVTTWSAPHLRWQRTIDILEPAPPEDVGAIAWDGDEIIETGVFPFAGTDGPVPYRERWRRLPDDRPVTSWKSPAGIMVRAGHHALGVVRTAGQISARYWQHDGHSWQTILDAGGGTNVVPHPDQWDS